MPFEWFVALRYMRASKGQTALILSAVSVGVSVIVFLSALIGGLQTSLIEKTLGSQPHITLREPREQPRSIARESETVAIARDVQPASQRLRSIDQWPMVLREIEDVRGVTAGSPMVTGAGFAIRSDAKSPIVLRGVDPVRFTSIIDIPTKLVSGRFDVGGGCVVVGATLASDLGAVVGDKIRLASSEGIDDVVTVTGIFRLGNEAVDRTWVITSLQHAQSLFALPGGATTIEIKVADVFEAEKLSHELHERTGLDADSWMKLNAELLAGLTAQSSSKNMIQFFVIVAVALGIASVLIVSVVQKAREIGILRAVGVAPRRILYVFLIQGGLLGLSGSFAGSALGALFAKAFESLASNPDGTPRFPVALDLELFAFATVLATSVGVIAALVPAFRAAKLDPISAIRNG